MTSHIANTLRVLQEATEQVPEYMSAWLDNDPSIVHLLELDFGDEKPLCEWLGVNKEAFPPVESLEEDEVAYLVTKIQELWLAYHVIADLPDGISVRDAYVALLDVWEEPILILATGRFHFQFPQFWEDDT